MKIGIVGAGFVGSTAGYAVVLQGVCRELVLVDMNRDRSEAEAADIRHAVPFAHAAIVRAGDYSDLADSRLVILSAGVGQKPGETRLQLLARNAAVFESIVPQIVRYAPEAILLVATNPVDIMTHLAANIAAKNGGDASRVLGSGTTLDTARFRSLLSDRCGVDAHHIHAYVLGEHGDSEVLAWSLVTLGGMPLDEFLALQNKHLTAADRETIDLQVRRAAYTIIQGKGATYYGVGAALARIASVILRNQRSIMTVCVPEKEVAGVPNVTVSLPRVLGGSGVQMTLPVNLSAEEQTALAKSAKIIRDALDALQV
jgi:L-lactate dehydrogenase